MEVQDRTESTVNTTVQDLEPPSLSALTASLVEFLERYGVPALVGRRFCELIGPESGRRRFQRLLEATGFGHNPDGFCRELVRQLQAADSRRAAPIRINDVELPHLLLVAALETMMPKEKFTTVKSVAQLEALTHTSIPAGQRDDMQAVLETYPVRLSSHVIRQMRVSPHVGYQYLPFVEELDPVGHVNTWIGQFHQGLLEQMYQNRVIFLLNMSCPVYCRFCFRKHKESRHQTNPSREDVRKAVEYVGTSPTIKEIVITGGDPFMNRDNLACAIEGLKEIPHVQTLRLATRSIAYYPNLFLARNGSLLKYIKAKNYELQMSGKRMEVATHFIHPDEISPQSLELITDLVNHGIAVYVQTPFLKDCNDRGPELVRLFGLLRGAGAELHYIYIPCSPIQGNRIYWTPIADGLRVAHYLRAHLSDRVIPRICTATPIGKMDWHSSGWAVAADSENPHFIWIRTPYTSDYFKSFAPIANELDIIRVNGEGSIDIRYMAEIGDESLFLGARPSVKKRAVAATDEDIRSASIEADRITDRLPGVVDTGIAGLHRVHQTRVEIQVDRWRPDSTDLKNHPDITDVVLLAEGEILDHLHRVQSILERLRPLASINAVRLRSPAFRRAPGRYSNAVLDTLGELNRVTVVTPQRLEIEARFLRAEEIEPRHAVLAENLRNRGITVYNNTPLLSGVNDSPEAINRLAFRLRECGIEFHHLYVAGLPLQQQWNRRRPVDVVDVIDIATRVRRDGSGREIPRYVIATELGEVDFGLTATLLRREDGICVRLAPYRLAYYRDMAPDFQWPPAVTPDADDIPMLKVEGLTDTGNFLVVNAA